jgi:hypothetical protein
VGEKFILLLKMNLNSSARWINVVLTLQPLGVNFAAIVVCTVCESRWYFDTAYSQASNTAAAAPANTATTAVPPAPPSAAVVGQGNGPTAATIVAGSSPSKAPSAPPTSQPSPPQASRAPVPQTPTAPAAIIVNAPATPAPSTSQTSTPPIDTPAGTPNPASALPFTAPVPQQPVQPVVPSLSHTIQPPIPSPQMQSPSTAAPLTPLPSTVLTSSVPATPSQGPQLSTGMSSPNEASQSTMASSAIPGVVSRADAETVCFSPICLIFQRQALQSTLQVLDQSCRYDSRCVPQRPCVVSFED